MAGRDGNGVGEDLAGFADLTGVRVVEKPEPQLAVDEHVVPLGKGSVRDCDLRSLFSPGGIGLGQPVLQGLKVSAERSLRSEPQHRVKQCVAQL